MNFAECCTNELEFRFCMNCKNIQYKIYKPFEKNVNVYYQRLLKFVIFHNKLVYYYFGRLTHLWFTVDTTYVG